MTCELKDISLEGNPHAGGRHFKFKVNVLCDGKPEKCHVIVEQEERSVSEWKFRVDKIWRHPVTKLGDVPGMRGAVETMLDKIIGGVEIPELCEAVPKGFTIESTSSKSLRLSFARLRIGNLLYSGEGVNVSMEATGPSICGGRNLYGANPDNDYHVPLSAGTKRRLIEYLQEVAGAAWPSFAEEVRRKRVEEIECLLTRAENDVSSAQSDLEHARESVRSLTEELSEAKAAISA